MKTNQKKLVMFDYDGVIADSYCLFTTSFLKACRRSGFDQVDSAAKVMALFDGNLYDSLQAYQLDNKAIHKVLAQFQKIVSPYLDEVYFFDGMVNTLAAIAKLNKVYIITSNLSQVVRQSLAKNGVDGVEGIIGAEEDTSKINKIEKVISQSSDLSAYYVGDTKGDMFEGRYAGAITVAVTWGWHAEKKLREGTPDHVIHSQDDLVSLLC